MQVVIRANAPSALVELCGVSLLERLLRILQRLGVRDVVVVSDTPEEIRAAIERPSWARRTVVARLTNGLTNDERYISLPGDIYCDARLVRALLESNEAAVLVDSNPPADVLPLLENCARSNHRFVSGAAVIDHFVSARAIDAAKVSPYVVSMRRDLRPLFFPAPPTHLRRLAEKLILDTGQPGTLDIPAIVHSPMETFIMRGLCRTPITPNQITAVGVAVAFLATYLFATGHLWLGMIPALAIGIIDGLDGKQARVKIETTPSGKWEHYLDFIYEMSWWAALAFWFQSSRQLPHAWIYFLIIVGSDGIDRLGKLLARVHIDRLLDDYTPFDRFVRLVGARRDIYLSMLLAGLAMGAAPSTYRLCAIWGVITAGVHLLRGTIIAIGSKIANASRQVAAQT